ncbi:unnamed protein product [Lactuca virosa]|uniref:NB-ARC domain-containing protein n=1 Tax=Lactuca virosa TaxID=75947 RepID=A0AAU9N4R0_9ASTR|nr:unnamed protein product [Lactuca virosa]
MNPVHLIYKEFSKEPTFQFFTRGGNKMEYAHVQMFMEKLKQLIYSDDIPMINNPSILCERPQFQLLYEELDSMMQTLFNHEDQDLYNFEKVRKLKKRFKATAEEAEDIVDIFLSAVYCRYNEYFTISDVFQTSLNLEDVIRSIKSIKVEFMTAKIDHMKMDSSQRTDRLPMKLASVAGTSNTRNLVGSKKAVEKIVVGIDRDAEIIRDKLVEDGKHLDVVSIVGMGGLGKTTLAKKVFTDPYVVYHFHVRGWVTVSQTYDKRDLLIQVLSSIDKQLELEEATNSQLHEKLHKRLNRQKYLIVIDDIWSKEAWDKLKLFFPDDNTGSRIVLTTRLTEVASHAKSHGLIHHLQHLSDDESWKLLCEKAFQEDECPEWLIEPGKQIAKNCHGLPLSVVVMAGALAKEARSQDLWVKISCSVHSYIASDEKGCLETIALSYHHLPLHLRDCFLYLGGIPEDSWIVARTLILLWMAEGFIQDDGCRSLEEIGKGYLMDLVDRNLLIVEELYITGDVQFCKVHDLVRQLSVEKGKEENFFLKIEPPSSGLCDIIGKQINKLRNRKKAITTHEQCRVVTNQEIDIMSLCRQSTPNIRSLLCNHRKTTFTDNISKFFRSFALLRVLNLERCELIDFSPSLALLVHLRYLEIWISLFPSSICNLWNLQSLLVRTSSSSMLLPSSISNLVNLRHLGCNADLFLPSIGKPMKLESISNVVVGVGVDNFKKYFPREEQFQRLKILRLEELNIKQLEASSINFPCLKELEVVNCVDLEEIPLELGDISTLECIYVVNCCASLLVSLQKIRQEQDVVGNYELEIIVDERNMPSCVPRNDD